MLWNDLSKIFSNLAKQCSDLEWTYRKRAAIEALPEKYRLMVSVLLDNTKNDHKHVSDIFNNIVIPATVIGFPNLIAHRLIGVQPIIGIGKSNKPHAILALRYTEPERIKLDLIDCDVLVSRLPYSAKWSKLESNPALAAMNKARVDANLDSIDLEEELASAICQEIAIETNHNLLKKLRAIPPAPTDANSFDQAKISSPTTTVVDEFSALAVLIGRQSNLIATKTRRNKANWVVVSPTALTILEASRGSPFTRIEPADEDFGFPFMGILNQSIRVYCDTYADDSTPVLVGYKGETEVDAAAFWAPQIFVGSHEPMPDPNTFELVHSFYRQDAYKWMTGSDDYIGTSADYLGSVGINAETLSFI